MTKRKPHDTSWTSFIEQQIRDAERRGEFDDLPGAGKPIPGLDRPHDPLWWAKQLLEREGLSFTPETMQVRRDLERLLERLPQIPSEGAVRTRVKELNARIILANSTQTGGPPSTASPLDVEAVVKRWRALRG